jgi:retinol dehydrogenase 12
MLLYVTLLTVIKKIISINFLSQSSMMKTVLITGATSGIGKAAALALARTGFQIIFIARNLQKAEYLVKQIKYVSVNTPVDFFIADLSSLGQVRRSAEAFIDRYHKLDVLINNAGVCLPQRRITEDGFEETFQVNYLSHFLLTCLLLEELKKVPEGRIINVSSALYKNGIFDELNLQSQKGFTPYGAYGDTKLFNILFTLELAERLKGTSITVNALHPGVVRTNFGSELTGYRKSLSTVFQPFFLSPEKGAETSVYLASSEEVKSVTGKYFDRCRIFDLESEFINETNQKILWEKSVKYCGLTL